MPMNPGVPVAASSEAYVDQAFEQLGINFQMHTNPKLLKQVLEEDMYLGGFSLFVDEIQELLRTETSLAPMLNAMRSGILKRHPAIADFLGVAVKKNLFGDVSPIAQNIERSLHQTFLLEELVSRMSDLPFLIALERYFSDMKQKTGIRDSGWGEYFDVLRLTKSPFQAAKLVTIDKGTMPQYIDFRQRIHLTDKDLKKKNNGLYLNILEARAADRYRKACDNAMVASVLSTSLVRELRVDDRRGVVIQEVATGWASLYQTWNSPFVLRNLEDVEYILPKLLIPKVINSEPSEYLYYRGIALWATTNFILMRRVHKKTPVPIAAEMRSLAAEWAKINLKYAKTFVKQSKTEDSRAFMNKYRHNKVWDIFYALKYPEKEIPSLHAEQ